ncbi:hypothetical protein TNCV_3127311 [Trichonephila clavipes]|nr:hypothetical protein TNCV_3127311 [Trichonephila clavipes]
MSKQMVRRWCRQYSEGRHSVHDEERSRRPSDLAPSDFHVFLHLKKFLSSDEGFGNDKELKTSVIRWFHSPAAESLDRLFTRFDKCLSPGGG